MAKQIISRKVLVEKANQSTLIAVSVASFIVVFSLVATRSLVTQAAYQNRVIKQKQAAVDVLKKDAANAKQLRSAYDAFEGATRNSIGGISTGTDKRDGTNTKIVLDALPSVYDFPALATNIESLVNERKIKLNSINGTDDEVAQKTAAQGGGSQPVPMPFELSVEGDYTKTKELIDDFEKSIRPMKITSLNITGSQSRLTTSIKAETVYQPAKKFNVTTKVVK
ncbi:hypothetical protein KBC77_04455 [Candidatus Saccharibacteria bacterium]|nr:hypothetical protein [Candidatus Saccharibacteria bacterium]